MGNHLDLCRIHRLASGLVVCVTLTEIVTGCDQDPCDAMPSGVPSTPPQVCGFDTFTREQVFSIMWGGDFKVAGLPHPGPFASVEDLPEVAYPPGSDTMLTRETCRQCQSVCDCTVVLRGCAPPAPSNKSMPKEIPSVFPDGGTCGGTPTMLESQVLACRNGTCVFEDLASTGAALRDRDAGSADAATAKPADASGK